MSDSNNEQSNETGHPPTPNDSTNGTGERPTRSITVSIQYSYFTPNGLANLNRPNTSGTPLEAPDGSPEIPSATRPDGALVLSFRDVPTSTPQERLESIISIAAELAMRRFSDMMSQPKGITREQFDSLPVLKVDELPDKQNTVCSICYEPYEDEPDNILKRSRDDDLIGRSDSVKKQRSESPMISTSTAQQESTFDHNETDRSTNDAETPCYRHSPVQLPCNHIFGRECLYKWSQLENNCPLCRNRIVESAPEQAGEDRNENAANLNADAFERIRQALYSTPTTQQPQQPESGANATPTDASEGNDFQNFTLSRSGIVFLRPDSQVNAISARAPTASSSTDPAAALGESLNRESNPNHQITANESDATGVRADARRIHWIPLPITSIQLEPTGTAAAEGTNQNPAERERSPNDRLRTILNNIFNVTQSANTVNVDQPGPRNAGSEFATESSNQPISSSANNADSDSPATISSPNVAPSDTSTRAPRRRSILDHILRITNRHRGRPSNNNDPSESMPTTMGSQMFSTGVASYRNQDGEVSTFHVNDGPLPSPSQRNESTRDSTANSDRSSLSNNGDTTNENNEDSARS